MTSIPRPLPEFSRGDAALAVWLGVLPLLPTGLTYAGLPAFGYIDLALVPLVVLWVASRLAARGRTPAAFPTPILVWTIAIAAVAGAALLGLMAENVVASPAFAARLRESLGDVLRPMNQTSHPLYSIRVALTFLEGWLAVLLIGDICRRAPDPGRRARVAVAGWLAGFTLVSAFALVQYVTKFQLHPYWVKANPHIVRAHATLDDPNGLGAYLLLGIGLCVGWLWMAPGRQWRIWASLLVLGIVALGTTMSRAAIGAAALGTLGVLAFLAQPALSWQRHVRTAGRLVVAAVLLLAVGSIVARMWTTERTRTQPTSGLELAVKTIDPRESADWVLRGRVAWWTAAVNMIRERPLTGVGLGRFPRLMTDYGGGRWRENTHNLFLQVFSEAGIPGGLAFGTLAAAVCLCFVRLLSRATTATSRAAALGGLIGTTAFLMTHLTGHALLAPAGQLLWGSVVAVAAALAQSAVMMAPSDPARSARATRRRLLATGLALGLLAWYPAAAVLSGVGPRPGHWGYTWGLFDEEHPPDGASYRWTSSRALLELTPPPDASALELLLSAPLPVRDGEPVRVRVGLDGHVAQDLVLSTSDVQTIQLPLDSSRAGSRASIEIDVHPTFVPARVDVASTDRRALGIQLLRPRFVTRGVVDTRR